MRTIEKRVHYPLNMKKKHNISKKTKKKAVDKENLENSYEFFLSELITGDDPEFGHIIELMRAAGHIKEIQKILLLVSTPDSLQEDETFMYEVERESLRIFLFNITAAQLREALKLFGGFIELPLYNKLKNDFNEEQRITATALENYVNEFKQKKGLLYDILKPLRDNVFHYDVKEKKEALEWMKKVIADEKNEKPRSFSISLEKFEFGPGLEYDDYLFSKYLFWGKQGIDSLMKSQIEMWQIHELFLNFVKATSEVLIKRSKIPCNRPFGWILEYRYGFKKNK